MTWFSTFDTEGADETARKAMLAPLGAASPLWFAYAGMAGAGMTYWWMTQWTKRENLEALSAAFMQPTALAKEMFPALAAPPEAELPPVPVPELVAAPVIAALTDVTPEVVEPEVMEPEVVAFAAASVEIVETAAAEVVEAVEDVTEAVAEAAIEVVEATPDDLTRLVGIGPKLSVRLAEMGVTRYADIAAWTAKELAEFDAALDLKGRAVRESWVAQAKRYAADVSSPAI